MGTVWLIAGWTNKIIMKSIVFAFLLAAVYAEAEPKADADPALLYGAYGYGYPSTYAYGASPYAYSAYAGHYGYPYGYSAYRHFGKRSADAEAEPKADADAEAEPALLYGAYGYPTYGAYSAYSAYRPYAYSAYAGHYGYPYGYSAYRHFGKRSADAEPEANAEADPALLY